MPELGYAMIFVNLLLSFILLVYVDTEFTAVKICSRDKLCRKADPTVYHIQAEDWDVDFKQFFLGPQRFL